MELTGAQILIESLVEQGVDVVFGYPGGSILNIHDALYDNKHRIRHVLTSHEQGAAHAADGYARSTGKVGVCIATSGPGATNLVTGIATAKMDSVPIVAITGNVAIDLLGRDSFQESDIVSITKSITKKNYIVKDITKLADTVREAFVVAASGRAGPVLIDIPKDITAKMAEFVPVSVGAALRNPKINTREIEDAVALINGADRPLIYSGGGTVFSGASEQLCAFMEKIDCPAAFSMMGLSALSRKHPLNLGMIGMHGTPVANKATLECDLLITIGARFSDRVAGNRVKFAKNAQIIHIDIDDKEHGKNVRSDHSLHGDAKEVLEILCDKVEQRKNDEWVGFLKQYKKDNPLPSWSKDGALSMTEVVKTANSVLEQDAIVVTDVGQHQMITAQNYNFVAPRSFVSSCGLGTMGFGMGAAIGAKIGNPKRRVVLFTGDGSFHMNLHEIACAVSENLPIIVIVLNNSVLGMVRQWQRLFYMGRYSNTSIARQTDLVALAKAFGADGVRVESAAQLADALEMAKQSKTLTVIDCAIDKNDSVYPIIPPGGEAGDMLLGD